MLGVHALFSALVLLDAERCYTFLAPETSSAFSKLLESYCANLIIS
jgi:hypothetical protein